MRDFIFLLNILSYFLEELLHSLGVFTVHETRL